MDRQATKDEYELETEEAERLVRPAPKVKPPRHDKMREDVHEHDADTDGDPDLKGDPDMSVNYKDVGGSLAERVLTRFAAGQWIRVKNREEDVVTRVRPDTLKEEPSKYQKVPPNEPPEEGGKPRPARKPQKPHYKKDAPPHPPWPDPRPMPPHPPRAARPPKPVKPVPVRTYPEPESPPKAKPPGWVPERRKLASMTVVARFLAADGPPTKKVKVRKKDTGWVGEVSEEAVKKDPASYEVVDTAEPEKKDSPPSDAPAQPEAAPATPATTEDKAKAITDPVTPIKFPPRPSRDSFESDAEFEGAQKKYQGALEQAKAKAEARLKEKPTPDKFEDAAEYDKAAEAFKKELTQIRQGLGMEVKEPKIPKTPTAKQFDSDKEFQAALKEHQGQLAEVAETLGGAAKPDRKYYLSDKEFQAVSKARNEAQRGLDKAQREAKRLSSGMDVGDVKIPKAPNEKQFDTEEEYQEALKEHTAEVTKVKNRLTNSAPPERGHYESDEAFEKATKARANLTKEVDKALGVGVLQPKRRPVSPEETQAMQQDIAIAPIPVEVKLQLLKLKLHPDDWQRIKAGSAVQGQVPIQLGKLDEHVALVKGLPGNGDPSKIPPPKQAKNAKGEMVPYESLPQEDQQEAWAQHRNDVMAAHIGAQAQVQTAFRKSGAPAGLARVLAEAAFGKSDPDAVFRDVLESGSTVSLSPRERHKLISKMPNDSAKAIATRYMQGQDYLDVRAEFLDVKSEKGISEYSPVKDIKSAIAMGSQMLEERAKGYPEEYRDPQIASQFRNRVLRRLEALDPHKAVAVQKAVDDMDADDYDKAVKGYDKAEKAAKKELEKREKQRKKLQERVEKEQTKAQEKATYRMAPESVKPLEDRLKEEGLDPKDDPVAPKPPEKPARYDLIRGNIPKAKDQHADLLRQTQEPEHEVQDDELEFEPPKRKGPPPLPKTKKASVEALAARVAGRYLAFSSCAG